MGRDGGFGALLCDCRGAAVLSQAELAERSGLTARTISSLEAGRIRWPHPTSVRRLADALGLSGDQREHFVASAGRRITQAPPGPAMDCDQYVVPRQLPAPVRHFVGREAEIKELRDLPDTGRAAQAPAAVIGAIGGSAGVGKTTLAVHWAHQVADRFPDGQLYIDLRGWSSSADPVAPEDAVSRFLDALGVPAGQVPSCPDARQDLYRSLTACQRMLIVLDNARDAAQVRPLLPGGYSCMVLVTSRSQLASLVALEAAHPVSLDMLTAAEGRELLALRVGQERVAAEPGPAGELVELCARLPLALAIAASRGALRPGLSLAALTEGLRDATGRLAALDTGDGVSVEAVFSWSYRDLPGPARRMFRLLGIHPGPDISVPAAASLAGTSRVRARELLEQLAGANLLAEHPPGRFRFHDLLRSYAAERAGAEDTQAQRRTGIHRALDHYLHSAHGADQALRKGTPAFALGRTCPGVTPELFCDCERAMAWLDADQHVLTALAHQAVSTGFDIYGWQLAMTLGGFFDRRGHSASSLALQRAGLAAAERLGNRTAQALLHLRIGNTCVRLGAYQDAEHHHQQALDLNEELGDQTGQARAHLGLCTVRDLQGHYQDSLRYSLSALALSQSAGDRTFQAVALNNAGWCHTRLGEYEQALVYCREAISIHHELGEPDGEAHAWDSLGYTYYHLRQQAEAVFSYEQALALFRQVGDRFYEALILGHLGDAHRAGGRPRLAVQAWHEAAVIFGGLRHYRAQEMQAKLRQARRNPRPD